MAERQGAPEHLVMTRIGQAVMLHRGGDREEARNRLAQLWRDTAEDGDPFHRCTIAHYLAGTQDDPVVELAWDLRALAEADAAVAEPPRAGREAAVRALYPALYLRLAANHARLGNSTAAQRELGRARCAAGGLKDDDYGAGIRAAIGRLARGLGPSPWN